MSTFPIGTICEPNLGRVVDETGADVSTRRARRAASSHGPNVMHGYWNLPEQNATRLPHRRGRAATGTAPATSSPRTPAANIATSSRRDRMVKRRGYRVELGEIEAALPSIRDIREAAVVAVPEANPACAITAS